MIVQSHLRSCLERVTRTMAVSKNMAQSSCSLATTSLSQPRQHLLLHGQRSFHGTLWKQMTEYYYDSQSGKHVPVHDESHVSILLQASASATTTTTRVATEWATTSRGISGLVAKNKDSYHDVASVKALYTAMQEAGNLPDTFELWVNAALVNDEMKKLSPPPVVVYCVDYRPNDDNTQVEIIQDTVSTLVQKQHWSAIACRAGEADALSMAAGVASIIDSTAGAGGDYVHVEGDEGDAMVELIEELAYLDVEGPTLKARMVVNLTLLPSSSDEAGEVVEESLLAGINKYVVDEDQLPWLVDFVQEQGKTCNVQVSS